MSADVQTRRPPANDDEDWEEVKVSRPEDTISESGISDNEAIDNDQAYVHVDHPRQTSYRGRIYRDPSEAAQGPIPTLRKALYALKDAIKPSIQLLTVVQSRVDPEIQPIADNILAAQQKQAATLNAMLTNYTTDWEVFAQQGGMSYEEFAALDVGEIRSYAESFQTLTDTLRQAEKWRSVEKTLEAGCTDRESIDRNGIVELDLGDMQTMQLMAGELSKLLKIKVEEESSLERAERWSNTEADGDAGEKETLAPSSEQKSHDESVHNRMLAVSDW